MNCNELNLVLEQSVESRTRPSAQALAHLPTCVGCHEVWALQSRLDAAIRAWHFVKAPPPPTQAVIAALAQPDESTWADEFLDFDHLDDLDNLFVPSISRLAAIKAHHRRRDRGFSLATAVGAACLMLAFVLSISLPRADIHPRQPELAQLAMNDAKPLPDVSMSPNLSSEFPETIHGIGQKLHMTASETITAAREIMEGLHPIVVTPDEDDARVDLGETKEKKHNLGCMLPPIKNRLERGLGFLWHAAPGD